MLFFSYETQKKIYLNIDCVYQFIIIIISLLYIYGWKKNNNNKCVLLGDSTCFQYLKRHEFVFTPDTPNNVETNKKKIPNGLNAGNKSFKKFFNKFQIYFKK